MQGVEICKRNQHIPHYRKRKDANTIYSYAATRLLHDDACILHLQSLLDQRDVVDARTHSLALY